MVDYSRPLAPQASWDARTGLQPMTQAQAAYSAGLADRQQGAGTSNSVLGAIGNSVFGGIDASTYQPTYVDRTVELQEATEADRYRQQQAASRDALLAQALGEQAVAQQQARAQLAQANAQASAQAQGAMGGQRAGAALQAAAGRQAAYPQAAEAALAAQLQAIQQAGTSNVAMAEGDSAAREASFRAAKADQDSQIRAEEQAMATALANARKTQANTGRLVKGVATLGASELTGILGL